MAWTFEATRAGYAKLWRAAQIKPGADDRNADLFADKIIAAEPRYRAVQAAIGVPWFFTGALDMRESGCNPSTHLHNGDSLQGYTHNEPPDRPQIGHGPPFAWEESAIDALKMKNLHRVQDWSIERMLFSAEVYNGLGYVSHGTNSPYVWAGTTQEQTGKYVADHVWSSTFDDPQLGVAAVLKRLAEKRPDIAAALREEAAPPAGADKPSQGSGPFPMPEILPPQAPGNLNNLAPLLLLLLAALQKPQSPGATGPQPGDIAAMLLPLLSQLFGGAPLPLPPPVIVQPPPAPPPEPSPLTRPSVQLGTAGLFGGILAQLLGVVGTPFGMGEMPTTAGTLTTLLPLATAAIGATGGFGTLASIGLKLLGGLISSKAKP